MNLARMTHKTKKMTSFLTFEFRPEIACVFLFKDVDFLKRMHMTVKN